MQSPDMNEGASEKEPAKNGQEYFEGQEGVPYTVKNETDDTISIDVRPGLLSRVIASGVAIEKGKSVSFELEGEQLTITPMEARNILEKSMDDLLAGN